MEKITRKDFLKLQEKFIKSELYKSFIYDLTARATFLIESLELENFDYDLFEILDLCLNEQMKKCDKIILSKEFFGEDLEKKIDFNF